MGPVGHIMETQWRCGNLSVSLYSKIYIEPEDRDLKDEFVTCRFEGGCIIMLHPLFQDTVGICWDKVCDVQHQHPVAYYGRVLQSQPRSTHRWKFSWKAGSDLKEGTNLITPNHG